MACPSPFVVAVVRLIASYVADCFHAVRKSRCIGKAVRIVVEGSDMAQCVLRLNQISTRPSCGVGPPARVSTPIDDE